MSGRIADKEFLSADSTVDHIRNSNYFRSLEISAETDDIHNEGSDQAFWPPVLQMLFASKSSLG